VTDIRLAPPAAPAPRGTDAVSNFECVLGRSGRDAVWIRLAGELDLAAAPLLQHTLREPLAGVQLIVLDLRDVTFMDSTGLHVVIDSYNQARQRGSRLVMIRGSAQVDRLFELGGVSDRFEIVDAESVGPGSDPLADPRSEGREP
jgi:anti-anti-sigma factor